MISEPETLADFIAKAGNIAVITGAGVSTASGIPDYRDRDCNWKNASPVQYQDFINSARVRRRYWARSFAGWSRFITARPNRAHEALAALEAAGFIDTLITQNVDGLHQSAGSKSTIDLHGRLDTVRCLSCGDRKCRGAWQQRLYDANPDWQSVIAGLRPDGDVELDRQAEQRFNVPECAVCGEVVKPNVVFFGESVPRERVKAASDAIKRAGALLIIGSSLMVFSGFRFARLAVEFDKRIAIVNQGRTRGDDLAMLKLDGDCGDILSHTLETVGAGQRPARLAP